jgi:DNA polymerase III delta prime subunit
MNTDDTNKKIHHANVVIGRGDNRGFVFEILAKDLNFDVQANPDFLLIEEESFGIDDARNLEKWAIGKPLMGEMKVSLVVAKSITFEAQNALLKVLEEPTLGTYIFINLENLGGILPTFISRVRILQFPVSENSNATSAENIGSNFFNSKIKEKLSIIRSLAKKEDKNDMKEIIKNLEIISYENYIKKTSSGTSGIEDMRNILTAKIFASSRGSSPKMLLEWLSCML